jgi:hypothetical protein
MSLTELGSEWERLYKRPTPKLGTDLLSRSIAYRLQERQYGGLTATARRQIKRLAKQLGNGAEVSISLHGGLKPGTRLSRDWHGNTCHVRGPALSLPIANRQCHHRHQMVRAKVLRSCGS